MFPKPIRVENKALMKSYRDRRCLACYRIPSDPCHIRSRGSGGGDFEWNIVPLCRDHHVEQHKIGWDSMRRKHTRVDQMLTLLGWEKLNGRLWHPKLGVDDDAENL